MKKISKTAIAFTVAALLTACSGGNSSSDGAVATKEEADTEQTSSVRDGHLFGLNLTDCEPYAETYIQPLSQLEFIREIHGFEDDRCVTVTDFGSGIIQTCRYTEGMRIAVAEMNIMISNSSDVGFSSELDFATGEQTATIYIDGQAYDSPFEQANASGECVTVVPDEVISSL